GSAGGAISGDRVRARVIRGRDGGRRDGGGSGGGGGRSQFTGRVIEVIERGQEHFVGVLVKEGNRWMVEPDGRSLHEPVLIRDPQAKNAKPGDKVVIELLQYPEGDFVAEGVITKVLGEAGRPDVETQAVIEAHGLRTEFREVAVEQARGASRSFDGESKGPWPDREDLTGAFIFTIDPPDAKDFDDAISIRHDSTRNEWTLGVHIADVTHFVEHGSPLDEEGRARGNSVYLPRLVIPMLPETLSNGVCSLQEGVNRFTKSAFITFDREGNVVHQRLSSTVIRSAKRLTYLEAQALIDGNVNEARQHAKTKPEYSEELIETLRKADRLAKVLEQRRMRDGMIVLNLPEVDLVFDDDGHVVDAVPEDDAYTHKLIEMFMVEANEALARTFDDLSVPVLRRIHPEPAHGDIQELRMFARAAHVDVPDQPTRRDLQRLLEATKHTPAARAIHFAVLRTLAKASYSPTLIGHFALASEHYAHFTSPIRRYPDLSLHRTLQAYLEATDNGRNVSGGKKKRELSRRIMEDDRVEGEAELIGLGAHCSETEVEAELAERELREFLIMQFLSENHLGDEFTAVVTGMMSSGVFVSIDRFLVEGRVRWQDIGEDGSTRAASFGRDSRAPGAEARGSRWSGGGDRGGRGGSSGWIVNESTGRARASRSGAELAIGDIVTVQIVAVDLGSRHLDLLITKLPQRGSGKDVQRSKGSRQEIHADESGTRRGSKQRDAKQRGRKQRGTRSGFKQGRRGRKSR
ncbi:MAG: VacB/RNase II family 3'-5' exoribonuclease, partial [Phycisphaerales bacterium]|nr:VacB/RNase II family 3'-5' exoribonuclease [Phycisphaerales bacterium]